MAFDRWIFVHWFELTTITLLALNLWFVIEVLRVLRAVKDALMLLAGWLDRTRDEGELRRKGGGNESDDPSATSANGS